VDPGQPASHPSAGLVEVRRRPGGQLLAHELGEPLQPPQQPRPPPRRACRSPRSRRTPPKAAARPGRWAGAGGPTGSTPAPAPQTRSRPPRGPRRGRRRRSPARRRSGTAAHGARPRPSAAPAGQTPVGPRPQPPPRRPDPARTHRTAGAHAPRPHQAWRPGPDGHQGRRAACQAYGAPQPAQQRAAPPTRACQARQTTVVWRNWRSSCPGDAPARRPGLRGRHWPSPAWRWPRVARRSPQPGP
jgi:hypothetical protein